MYRITTMCSLLYTHKTTTPYNRRRKRETRKRTIQPTPNNHYRRVTMEISTKLDSSFFFFFYFFAFVFAWENKRKEEKTPFDDGSWLIRCTQTQWGIKEKKNKQKQGKDVCIELVHIIEFQCNPIQIKRKVEKKKKNNFLPLPWLLSNWNNHRWIISDDL